MGKLSEKVIIQRYFEEIRDSGTGVPRDKNMDGVPGVVSRHYIFKASETGEKIEVRCIRTTPYYYKLIQ